LYPSIATVLHFLIGWLPFSFGDIIYSILVLYLIREVFLLFKRKTSIKFYVYKILALISIVFFFFNFNWGLNYLREPLFKSLQINNASYEQQELIDFTKKIIAKTNEAHLNITKIDTVLINHKSSKSDIQKQAKFVYNDLKQTFPKFKIHNFSTKHSLYSLPLTYMGFAGYLNPWTNEAQVNYMIPKNNYPATLCHEIAHQVGYASESEANFVGYLACITSKDKYFNYSGYLMAMRYCLSEVYRKDKTAFENLQPLINKGVLKDLKQSREFWLKYQNKSEKFFKLFYDSFLKMNKQKDGIKGYSKMVRLLINYYKTNSL
jgi:hypothetical protein